MPGPVVQVEGARTLRRTLRRAGDDMGDLKAAHRRAGAVVTARAAALAPRRTGALAQSVRAGAAATSVTLRAGYARTPYAGAIHWGWPSRGIAPQPFISDAATSTEPTWLPAYLTELQKIIDRVKGA